MTRLMLNSARLQAGRTMWRSPSIVRNDHCTPSTATVAPRPVLGSQPSWTAKTMISISPTQKVGRLKPRMLPAISARAPGELGRSPA